MFQHNFASINLIVNLILTLLSFFRYYYLSFINTCVVDRSLWQNWTVLRDFLHIFGPYTCLFSVAIFGGQNYRWFVQQIGSNYLLIVGLLYHVLYYYTFVLTLLVFFSAGYWLSVSSKSRENRNLQSRWFINSLNLNDLALIEIWMIDSSFVDVSCKFGNVWFITTKIDIQGKDRHSHNLRTLSNF